MTAKEAYEIHRAVWLHFQPNSKYDYFRYNGKVRRAKDDDRQYWQFTLLSREFSETEFPFYLAFMYYQKPRIRVQEFRSNENLDEWRKWKLLQKSRVDYLSNDLKLISQEDLVAKPNQYPPLFNKINSVIRTDSFIIIDSILQVTKQWQEQLADDFAYMAWLKRYQRWRPFFYAFMPYDRETFNTIISKELT